MERIIDLVCVSLALGFASTFFVLSQDHKVFLLVAVFFGCVFGVMLWWELRDLNAIMKDIHELIKVVEE